MMRMIVKITAQMEFRSHPIFSLQQHSMVNLIAYLCCAADVAGYWKAVQVQLKAFQV